MLEDRQSCLSVLSPAPASTTGRIACPPAREVSVAIELRPDVTFPHAGRPGYRCVPDRLDPVQLLVARLAKGTDIRHEGSRNVGATNVIRTAGKVPGMIALLLDLAKGYVAVDMARWIVSRPDWPFAAPSSSPLHSRELWIALAGLIAVLGHMFPVWLRFHGGKGVATATGVFLALDPQGGGWRA